MDNETYLTAAVLLLAANVVFCGMMSEKFPKSEYRWIVASVLSNLFMIALAILGIGIHLHEH
jgi:predicted transglutaminase-like protease